MVKDPELMLRGMHYGSHNWWRQCGSKRAHYTFAAALKTFDELLPKPLHNENNSPLTIYLCGWCEWYHLGHLPKKRTRADGTVFAEIRRPHWFEPPPPHPHPNHYVGSFARSNV